MLTDGVLEARTMRPRKNSIGGAITLTTKSEACKSRKKRRRGWGRNGPLFARAPQAEECSRLTPGGQERKDRRAFRTSDLRAAATSERLIPGPAPMLAFRGRTRAGAASAPSYLRDWWASRSNGPSWSFSLRYVKRGRGRATPEVRAGHPRQC